MHEQKKSVKLKKYNYVFREGWGNMEKIVVALGGNAILTDDPSAEGQIQALKETAGYLIELIKQDKQLIVSHGNGPQVGNLLLQQSAAHSEKNPAMPLDTCVAMTQGSIGYWLQNSLLEALRAEQIEKSVASLITQIVVDPEDPAFGQPSKPIGPFITQEEAEKQAEESGDTFIEDAGRGYRKVVPSPRPIDIVEADVIQAMVEQDIIPVAAGGGGIPVLAEGNRYVGVEAVIDKDFASAKLAELVDADTLLILTGVSHAYINYNQTDEVKIEGISANEMKDYIEQGHFAAGSMLPKVKAAVSFVENKPEGKAIITSLENIGDFLKNGSATVITK